ncbi:NADH-quinone oxidoreductase subunit H [bacterium]|nr:NADH-quinone oxidoreductase subunit H [bacterium]
MESLTLKYFGYFIGIGCILTPLAGMLASWVDRKVTARVQWRVGPPLLQPFWDFVKLLGKETVVPRGSARTVFLMAPLLGFSAVALVSTILWSTIVHPETGFVGDLIVVLYLLMIPSMAVILGGFASKNPIASLGASREMKLILGYELPFILACLVAVIHTEGSIRLGEIIIYQNPETYGPVGAKLSGILAIIVCVMVVQAKLTCVPFDIPEAETEIMSGPFVEYSGPPLAVYKLTRMMMLITLPVFLVILFLGGMHFQGWAILWSILKVLLFLVLVTLIRNTNPRVRIDQAVRFFWGPMTVIAVAAVILALTGN